MENKSARAPPPPDGSDRRCGRHRRDGFPYPSENLEVVRTVVEGGGRIPVISGTGYNVAIGVDLARQSASVGSGHAIRTLCPNSDDEGLAECYAAMVSATPLPLFVYSRDWVNPNIACLLGGFLSDRQVRLWGRRWGRTLPGVIAYGLGGVFMLVAIPCSGGHARLAHFFLCLSSFVKDCGMGASWSTAIDIGHRNSPTVAGFMNTVGNLSQVIAVPFVAWLAMLAWSAGPPNWGVSLSFYAAMFLVLCGSGVLAVRRAAAAPYRLILRQANGTATEGWQGRICLEGDRKRHAQR